jgi:hypothetical protein
VLSSIVHVIVKPHAILFPRGIVGYNEVPANQRAEDDAKNIVDYLAKEY